MLNYPVRVGQVCGRNTVNSNASTRSRIVFINVASKAGAARVPALGKRSAFDFDRYLLRGKEVVKPPCALLVEPVFCV